MSIPRGYQPLTWTALHRYSPESVRGAHPDHCFPAPHVAAMLDAADEAHREAVYAENNEGGKSRGCVSAVARALGVDITTGPGSMWSNDRMRKVIDAARALKDDRDHWEQEAANWQAARDTWKALAEQHAAELAPAQWQLRSVIQERDVALERLANARELLAMRPEEPDDVDVLRATVVRQANEITELKGESA